MDVLAVCRGRGEIKGLGEVSAARSVVEVVSQIQLQYNVVSLLTSIPPQHEV